MSTRCRCLSTRTVTNVTRARETETTIKPSSYLVTNFGFARASDTGDNSPQAPSDPAPPPQVRRPGIQSRKSGHVCHICHPTNENIICRSTPSPSPPLTSKATSSTSLRADPCARRAAPWRTGRHVEGHPSAIAGRSDGQAGAARPARRRLGQEIGGLSMRAPLSQKVLPEAPPMRVAPAPPVSLATEFFEPAATTTEGREAP